MFINSLFLAISSSIDSLGIGITYGIKNTKISHIGKMILFLISFVISILSIWFGNVIKNIFSNSLTTFIGSGILIGMGVFVCFQAFKKEKTDLNHCDNITLDNTFYDSSNCNFSITNNNNTHKEEKIYSFFIEFLGITIKIIKNPTSSDFDGSHSIDAKEALFLGLALSLDSFCIGVGGSVIGVSSILFPLFIASFQLLFLNIGNFLGRKLKTLSFLPDNIWSVISGCLLILMGVAKLLISII